MKTRTKSLVIGGIAGTLGIGALATAGIASAETKTVGDPASGLVQKIASTFQLDKNEVQKVFDEDRAARHADHEKRMVERLQKLVDDGVITATQKTAIETKLKQLAAARAADHEALKDLTQQQRRAMLDERRSELESWAKDQGIDLSKIKGLFGGHGHGGVSSTES